MYSPTNVAEPFYLCYVLEKCVAREDVSDINNHEVLKGSKYLKCKYYQKKQCNHWFGFVEDEEIYVLPHQVVCPCFNEQKKSDTWNINFYVTVFRCSIFCS